MVSSVNGFGPSVVTGARVQGDAHSVEKNRAREDVVVRLEAHNDSVQISNAARDLLQAQEAARKVSSVLGANPEQVLGLNPDFEGSLES